MMQDEGRRKYSCMLNKSNLRKLGHEYRLFVRNNKRYMYTDQYDYYRSTERYEELNKRHIANMESQRLRIERTCNNTR